MHVLLRHLINHLLLMLNKLMRGSMRELLESYSTWTASSLYLPPQWTRPFTNRKYHGSVIVSSVTRMLMLELRISYKPMVMVPSYSKQAHQMMLKKYHHIANKDSLRMLKRLIYEQLICGPLIVRLGRSMFMRWGFSFTW